MKRILALLLLVSSAAVAQTVTLSTGASCTYESFTLANRNVTVQCATAPQTCPPPQPPSDTKPCPPGQVGSITTTHSCVGSTWTASVVNSCMTPPASGVVMRDLGPQGQSTRIQMQNGIVYASQLANLGAPIPSGLFGMTSTGQTPGGVEIEVSISPTPGDMAYRSTPAACYQQWGSLQCPCGGVTSPESAGVQWAPKQDPYGGPYCVTQAGWYVNYKMIGGSGEMIYFWNPH